MIDREQLDKLIDAALADNKLTSKEMEVLIKKAKQLGIDEDEFLIELDAKKYHSNRIKKSEKKRISKKLLIIIVSAILIFSVFIFIFLPSRNEKFETALSNYDFKTAYILLSKYSDSDKRALRSQQLIKAAVPYYLKNNQIQLAIDALSEYQFKYTVRYTNIFYRREERAAYNLEADFFNSLWLDIAYFLVKNAQIDKGLEIVNLKLVPYTGSDWDPTFEPIQEKVAEFKAMINELPKH